jgi:hypothetical protein
MVKTDTKHKNKTLEKTLTHMQITDIYKPEPGAMCRYALNDLNRAWM